MDRPKYVYVIYIAASPERVWEGLTSPEFTAQYWKRAESTWEPGAPITHWNEDGTQNLKGEVLQSEPPRLLSYTFGAVGNHGALGEPASKVVFELEPMGQVTRLTVSHDDFPEVSRVYEAIQMGWPAILSNLKSLLETGQPLGFGRWE